MKIPTPKEIERFFAGKKKTKKGRPEMRRFQDRFEMVRAVLFVHDPNRFGGFVQIEGG